MNARTAVAAALTVIAGLIVAGLTTPTAGSTRGERVLHHEHRQSYWELDLSTPALGAQAFLDAWTAEHYLLVVQLLSEPARLQVVNAGLTGQPVPLVAAGMPSSMTADLQRENVWPLWKVLVDWTGARAAGTLSINLADAELIAATGPDSEVAIRLADGRDAVLRMVPSPSGRWTVAQIGAPSLSSSDQRSFVVDGCAADVEAKAASCGQGSTVELASIVVDPGQVASYRALDLSSPEAAVRTFVRLIDHEDYLPLFLTVEPVGQRDMYRIAANAWVLPMSVERTSPMFTETGEFGFGPVGSFDQGMRYLTERGELLIDVRGSVVIDRGTSVAFGGDEGAAVVEARSPHHPEGIGFVLMQSPAGRWRIRQVAAPPAAVDPDGRLMVIGGQSDP